MKSKIGGTDLVFFLQVKIGISLSFLKKKSISVVASKIAKFTIWFEQSQIYGFRKISLKNAMNHLFFFFK